MGVDVIETDVRSTSDGVLVVLHDATLERTTDGAGPVNKITAAELKKLDAGYKWSPDNGRSFPLRGRGITVPTLEEIFRAFPEMRLNIEPKQEEPSIVEPLCRLIRQHQMADKLIVGSFSAALLEQFRRACPEVATSASPTEVRQFIAMQQAGPIASYRPAMRALQVPEHVALYGGLNRSFIEAAHSHNLEVHAWTVNERQDMRRLIEMGVDGIMTDYPDRLMQLLGLAPARKPEP